MQDFLTKIGAIASPDGQIGFVSGDDKATTGACLLPARAWLGIAGLDAVKFMQGQFTCDVTQVSATQSQYGAHCTPKGRMVGNFRLCRRDEQDFLLGLAADNVAAVAANISKYIVFSKAKLSRLDDAYLAFGISGESGSAFVAQHFGTAPTLPGAQVSANGSLCFRAAGEEARFEVWVPAPQVLEFWQAASAALGAFNSRHWELADIRAGVVAIRSATSDELIPQAIGLQHIGGVSFTKGCYTGQEIVARTKYLGKLKRQLYHFTASSTVLPAVGGQVYKGQSTQSAGLIVAVCAVDSTHIEGLAVISTPAIGEGIFLDAAGSCPLIPGSVYAEDAD